MSCRLTVRTCDAVKQWDVDEWTIYVALASLSAEPETLAEWFEAVRRYQPDHRLLETGYDVGGIDEAGGSESWCLVDLVGKTVIGGGDWELPERIGAYEPSAGEEAEGFPIVWLDTPTEWLFSMADNGWEEEVGRRAEAAAAQLPRIDVRAILFGKELLEFLAVGVQAAAHGQRRRDEERELKLTRHIHAQWLMTARDDLGGRTPRQLLLADHDHMQRDLEHRSQQWTHQGHPALPLPTDSLAYRFGGFGTIEIVVYFDLVRSLLEKAWELVHAERNANPESMIERLAAQRDAWMQKPYDDGSLGLSAAALVESERRRMPIVSQGEHLDCDCPICRAEADGVFGSGPMFLWFDGHHLEMEDEFAFSFADSYKEWKSQQDSYQEFAAKMERERASTESLPGEDQEPLGDSVWKSTFVDWDQVASTDSSPKHSLFALAFPIAELVCDLKARSQEQEQVRALNDAYDDLRRADDVISAGLRAGRLCETLEEICRTYPELTPKCADLQSHIDDVLRRLV